jgi:hypothetical protein
MNLDKPIKWICEKHKEVYWYDETYDAFYCPYCNEWEEGTCTDPNCVYDCALRPKRPLKKKKLMENK